ncbi:MAG: hypothetical protein J3Q66DRAFT_426414 [Benniella sp.]|nr:MAG: hypothetical protein J3Q66DRAFT_426414 [Benniella sp.]
MDLQVHTASNKQVQIQLRKTELVYANSPLYQAQPNRIGLKGLWDLVKEHGYRALTSLVVPAIQPPTTTGDPPTDQATVTQPSTTPVVRVDVLGAFFISIRRAYTSHAYDTAHKVVEQAIQKAGIQKTAILYLDGEPTAEKLTTHSERAQKRVEAAEHAHQILLTLEDRLEKRQKLHKNHFKEATKSINRCFYWTLETRRDFASYMRKNGWTMRLCRFEADVDIASDCRPGDFVISSDSDMMGYGSVGTLIRAFRGKYHCYDMEGVANQLQLSREQLTALAVVSKNDYNKNISSLGPKTNIKIIRSLDGSDPETLVKGYLKSGQVVVKNEKNQEFENAINVFIKRTQSKRGVDPEQLSTESPQEVHPKYEELLVRFRRIQEQLDINKQRDCPFDPPNGQSPTNKFKTTDKGPACHPPGQPRRRKRRKRYSFKTRTRLIEHPQPDTLKIALGKYDLVNAMVYEHPIATLKVGTVKANVTRVLASQENEIGPIPNFEPVVPLPGLEPRIRRCLQDVVRLASQTKRICQRAIAVYLERLSTTGVSSDDRKVLDKLCPRISDKVVSEKEPLNEPTGPADEEDKTAAFMLSPLICIYNKRPATGADSSIIAHFVDRQQPYPAGTVLRSTASELAASLRTHFKRGSKELVEKIKSLQKKGSLPADAPCRIDPKVSAVENFLKLNKSINNPWIISPISSMEDSYVYLSEKELITVFWKDVELQKLLRNYARPTCPSVKNPSLQDMELWLAVQKPGYLINKLLTDIGTFDETQRKKKRGYARNTWSLSREEFIGHLNGIRHPDFTPDDYTARGYVLKGLIKTDGFQLQLLAFKTKELNEVKFKRLHESKLPTRINSTLGGTGDYLTEIRNVVRNREDVSRLWTCEPERIKVLGIDLGQAYVVGASALLPDHPRSAACDEDKSSGMTFFNLAVKQKAVYQPTFKLRRWSEHRKQAMEIDGRSITEIETSLPPVRGDGANIADYVERVRDVEEHLHAFYNENHTFKRKRWDSQKARQEEYQRITDSLLKMVGGSYGAKRDVNNNVVIGIGLGDFDSKGRLSSLHGSFSEFFVKTARSLGYIVVGVNEYFTSKECPVCEGFVGQMDIRRHYCPTCHTRMHRDVMAGHNIANVVRSHLVHQQRPLYLQPQDNQGNYIWMKTTTPEPLGCEGAEEGECSYRPQKKTRL